jgi:predicted lipid-binding transport protein (Tim44 family)
MDTDKKPNPVADYLKQMNQADQPEIPAAVAHLFPNGTGSGASQPVQPTANQDAQAVAIAKESPAAPAPAVAPAPAPSANLEQPAAPVSNELATTAGKRPLAHFGQALPVTKSKANRKLVVQLTPEMYQYLAHVSTLPGLDGVPLPDLAVAILQAWREDYRPEIKKANAAFKA